MSLTAHQSLSQRCSGFTVPKQAQLQFPENEEIDWLNRAFPVTDEGTGGKACAGRLFPHFVVFPASEDGPETDSVCNFFML